MLSLHHVAITVADLDAAIDWYTRVLGLRISRLEAETDVSDAAINLHGERVRLRGAELTVDGAGGPFVELHQFITPTGEGARRVCDTGISHFAFYTDDIHAEYDRLRELGVTFSTPPQYIADGGLAGDWWVYFTDPWGNQLQLVSQPATGRVG
ncbi:VOC family protein [Catenuloplanes atrovinosus]|uniref:Catechol 2,3-dioxygenase-like lactoylglutathione lyase family enzyme n=1 Tax=Catenuloplanes atrovinosus TaxID=137266 RepID=A0AAE4CBG2_9ACTN|nr:VOC family protein [Catenuloplanes atrovinosus]MDR7275580.1 catechol 2,3-dioxygenase-like lactoylglutathione lyase family enzyme [Catenuloplanes atrovinosus]